jgi:hypothetical protein
MNLLNMANFEFHRMSLAQLLQQRSQRRKEALPSFFVTLLKLSPPFGDLNGHDISFDGQSVLYAFTWAVLPTFRTVAPNFL